MIEYHSSEKRHYISLFKNGYGDTENNDTVISRDG
jgi:hypothetical protein